MAERYCVKLLNQKSDFSTFFYPCFCSIPICNTCLNLSPSLETVATFLVTAQCKIEFSVNFMHPDLFFFFLPSIYCC